MSEWRTIESAPQDGTVIIAAAFNTPWPERHLEGDVVKCWYEPEFGEFIESCRQMVFAGDEGNGRLHSPVIAHFRSHWMPLPSPPETST